MQWNDKAIVLSARRLGENSAIIHVITPEHGLCAGVDKGAFGKRKRGIYQPGNIVSAHWQARLSEHVGMLNCELMEPIAAYVLDDRRKLAALTSAMLMCEKILAEREPQPLVYERTHAFAHALRSGEDWLLAYVLLEFALLEHAGFGLDLARCASTGQSHDLVYVSPRTGRAVSLHAGKPYHDRLFKLPEFLAFAAPRPNPPSACGGISEERGGVLYDDPAQRGGLGATPCSHTINQAPPHPSPKRGGSKASTDIAQILDGVRLCGYFLHERVFAPRGAVMPAARKRFVEMLHTEELVFG